MSLSEYIKTNPSVLGTNRISDVLPILIKFIDAADKLSVQILEPIQDAIKEKAGARFGKKHTEMKFTSLSNDAGMVGTALLWKDNMSYI